jgi:hypothetical protein
MQISCTISEQFEELFQIFNFFSSLGVAGGDTGRDLAKIRQ